MTDNNDRQEVYAHRKGQELHHFDSQSKLHEMPAIAHYWSQKFLSPLLREHGFTEVQEFFAKYFGQAAKRVNKPAVFASLGTGDCHIEVQTAQLLKARGLGEFTIECLDLNARLLECGRAQAKAAGVEAHLAFVETDFNRWTAGKQYTAIAASHSLHHMVELEHMFDEVRRSLHPAGFFVVTDMIGRNGHMRWPEALEEMRPFWYELPREYRWHNLLSRLEEEHINHDCSTEGFEGIRAQDILQLLIARFDFRLFLAYSNLVDIFVDRGFGHNFDLHGEWDRDFIDRLHACDEQAILSGRLTPTHMYAVMTPEPCEEHFYSRGLTPERCVRRESAASPDGWLKVATRVLSPIEAGGLAYRIDLEACGGLGPYTWSAMDLPPGLHLGSEGRLEGAIDEDGVFTPIITVKDSSKPSKAAAQRYTIMVKPPVLTVPMSIISPGILADGWVGGQYAEALLTDGGAAPLHWTIKEGTLPQGLQLNAHSGEIRGTATRSSRYAFCVMATDATGEAVTTRHEITIGCSSQNMKRAGVLAHIAAGGSWASAIRLNNTGATPVEVALNFHASSGRRRYWTLGSEATPGSGHGHFTLAPHACLRVELAPGAREEISGWAEILATGPVGAHAELVFTSANDVRSEVTIPMERTERQTLQLAFDNSDGNRTAMAFLNVPRVNVVNVESSEPQPNPACRPEGLVAVVRDEVGRWIETMQIPLRPGRHKAFMLAEEIPATVGHRGKVEIQSASGGLVGGVSLRVSAQKTFVLLPLI